MFGARQVQEQLQGPGIHGHRVVVEHGHVFLGSGLLQIRQLLHALAVGHVQPADAVGQEPSAVAEDQLQLGVFVQQSGVDQLGG